MPPGGAVGRTATVLGSRAPAPRSEVRIFWGYFHTPLSLLPGRAEVLGLMGARPVGSHFPSGGNWKRSLIPDRVDLLHWWWQ